MDQVMIAMLGITAVWLSQDKRTSFRKYACLFGLAGQPFWFYATFTAGQWGIFVMCLAYTYAWGRGFYNNWIASEPGNA